MEPRTAKLVAYLGLFVGSFAHLGTAIGPTGALLALGTISLLIGVVAYTVVAIQQITAILGDLDLRDDGTSRHV